MFLKQLNIYGFKSFAEKTEIEFVPGITAVVGPNGSGKSNVTDALRWVLGEQSAKSLRGGTMEDIIFAGSDARKPLNYAEVSITLDNQSGKLPLDYNEINVKRRVYRSGESEFFINQNPCRLRDIVDLFTDSGLGREAFSIISQGKVDQILNSKPEERRSIFEEAAGVLKYKHRKRKTEEKLTETEENLHRVNDILHELEDQLKHLKEQAGTAKQYLKLKDELKACETGLAIFQIERLYTEWEKLKNDLEKNTDEEIQLSAQCQKLERELESQREQQTHLDEKVAKLQEELLSVSEQLEQLEGRRQVLQEKSKHTEERISKLQMDGAHLKKTKEGLLSEKKEAEQLLKQKDEEIKAAENELEQKKQELDRLDDSVDSKIEALKSEYVDLLNDQVSDKNERQYVEKQWRQLQIRLQKLEEDLTKQKKEKLQVEEDLANKKTELLQMKEKLYQLEREEEQIQGRLEKLKQESEIKQTTLFESYRKVQKLEAEKESLESLEEDFAGYMQGVREILKAKERLTGIEGTVAQLIKVPKEYEAAIEIALGGAVQHIVVQTDEDGRKAIGHLKKYQLGRATFLPLNIMRPKRPYMEQLAVMEQHDSFIGLAPDLISFEPNNRPVIENLLGNVVVAADLKGAGQLAKALNYRFRIVTPAGEIVNPGGSMSGGAFKQKKASLIGRKNQLDQLKNSLILHKRETRKMEDIWNQLKSKIEENEKLLQQNQREISEKERAKRALESVIDRLELSKANAENYLDLAFKEKEGLEAECGSLEEQSARLAHLLKEKDRAISLMDKKIEQLSLIKHTQQDSKDHLISEANQLKVRLAALTEQKTSARVNLERIVSALTQTDRQIEHCSMEKKSLEKERMTIQEETKVVGDEAEEKQNERGEILRLIGESRKERVQLHDAASYQETELKELKRQQKKLAQLVKSGELQAGRLEVELKNLLTMLRDQYELSYDAARENYRLTVSAEEAEETRQLLKQELADLGTVNIGAIDEYERVNSRYQFLIEQKSDLEQAKDTLYQIMDEMDEEMTKRFGQTFRSIQEAFGHVFRSLFGGGKAELKLTRPDDLLNTGVEIIAQPPGKKLQNLTLLSGGERALTAIALLFSILKVRPVPFCVLDEVEAAVDEANVHRFSSYLKKFSLETQFIVITHRQGTMAGADVLYGITMQESGVSKLVSVRLEESRVMAQI